MAYWDRIEADPPPCAMTLGTDGVAAGVIFWGLVAWAALVVVGLRIMAGGA